MPRITENIEIKNDPAKYENYKARIAAVNAWIEAEGHGAKARLAYGIQSNPGHIGQILDHTERVSAVTLRRMEAFIKREENPQTEPEPA